MKNLFAVSLLVVLITAGCADDDAGASMEVSTEITYGNQPLSLDATYPMGDYDVQFEVVQLYVGGFEMVNGANRIDASDTYILADEDGASALVFEDIDIEQGVDAIRFHVGVAPEINGQTEADFLGRSVEDPLSIKDPAMHWSWLSGYRFIRIDGVIDDNKDGVISDTETTSIQYHIGTDAFLAPLEITSDLGGVIDGRNTLTLRVDLEALLAGIDLGMESDRISHTNNNIELARMIQSNLTQGGIGFRVN